ncbi:hypothetical protein H6P81_007302 [Aristolochia fimbriata]|uniref:50S ribosomal protein L35 n=1 Tax=Aristolochia fimbriata TaxID=158543 RepID=A0AAV7F4B2_ARIFI|nr:hypothetical protein H6P81_007302 [Aristolochia fimbriata]
MMQKWSAKLLRPFIFPVVESRPYQSSTRCLLHSFLPSPQPQLPLSIGKHIFGAGSYGPLGANNQLRSFRCQQPFHPFTMIPRREFSSKERKRTPATPVTSKLKKTKMKSYSSFKYRFRTMNDGKIRRWRAGKRHNAHLKSKKSKRRLRQPEIVHAAYAKVGFRPRSLPPSLRASPRRRRRIEIAICCNPNVKMPEARDRLPGRGAGGSALFVGNGAGLHFGERPGNGIQERLDRGRFVNDENAPPQRWHSRRGVPSRRSPLPEWYPRTPLRDITAIVHSIELWNERQRARGAGRRRNRQHSPRTPLLLSSPSSAEQGSDSPDKIPPPSDASPEVPQKEVPSPLSTTPPAPFDEKTRLYWEELDRIAMVILENKRKEMEDKKKKKPEKSTLMSLR